jgi:hypothetical protein
MGGAQCSRNLGQYGALCTAQCGFSQARGSLRLVPMRQILHTSPPVPSRLAPNFSPATAIAAPACPLPLPRAGGQSGIVNFGYWGIYVQAEQSYTVALYMRTPEVRQRCLLRCLLCACCALPLQACYGLQQAATLPFACRLPARPPTHHKPPCTAASPAFYCPATFSLPRIAPPTGTVLLPPRRPLPAT